MKLLKNRKGFTLIEVVLVLAIGGLIFLLAFLAFQQVSTNRRDTQRRNDAGRILSEIQNYYGDRNSYPAPSAATSNVCSSSGSANSFQEFAWTYLCGKTSDGFKSPQGNYKSVAPSSNVNKDEIKFVVGQACDGSSSGNMVEIGLEKGTVCRDDQ